MNSRNRFEFHALARTFWKHSLSVDRIPEYTIEQINIYPRFLHASIFAMESIGALYPESQWLLSCYHTIILYIYRCWLTRNRSTDNFAKLFRHVKIRKPTVKDFSWTYRSTIRTIWLIVFGNHALLFRNIFNLLTLSILILSIF